MSEQDALHGGGCVLQASVKYPIGAVPRAPVGRVMAEQYLEHSLRALHGLWQVCKLGERRLPVVSTPMRLCCHLCDEGCHAHCSAVSIPLLSAAGLNSPDWRFLLSGSLPVIVMSIVIGCRGWSILRPVHIVGRVFLGNHPVRGSAGSRGHR